MSYKLSFGEHEGRTFEWLFFHAPWYVEFIISRGMLRQRHVFEEDESEYFRELYRRACGLTGQCRDCNERPIERLGLAWQHNGNLGMVGFWCDQCEYMGGSRAAYHPASFFVEAYTLARCDQKRITKEIKRLYLGRCKLTQEKMEAFFRNDTNFHNPTPGFFEQREEVLQ